MDKAAVDPRSLRGSRPWIGFFGQRPPRARVAGVPHPERPLAPSQAIHCQPRCLGWGQTPPQTLPGLVPAQVNWRQQRLQPFRLARGRLLDVETKINSALMDGSQSAWCNFKHRLLGLAPELPLQVRAAVVPRQQQAGADAECSRDAASTINDRLDDVQVPSFAPEAGATLCLTRIRILTTPPLYAMSLPMSLCGTCVASHTRLWIASWNDQDGTTSRFGCFKNGNIRGHLI